MTLFIASLFLPQTLGFIQDQGIDEGGKADVSKHLPVKRAPSNIPNLLNSFASRTPSTATTRHDTPDVLTSPAATSPRARLVNAKDGEQASLPNADDSISLLSARLSKVKTESSVGNVKRNLSIPQSRASSPPSSALITPRPPNMRTASMTRPAEYIPGEGKKKENSRRKSQASVNPFYSCAQYQTFDQDKGNGGLRNAVNAAAADGKIERPLWVGLLGIPSDEIAKSTKDRIHKDFEHTPAIRSLIVDVSDNTARLGYDHYWYHNDVRSRASTNMSSVKECYGQYFTIRFQILLGRRYMRNNPSRRYYEQLNQAFADRISKHYKRGDTIWINDYHLLLVPKMIRERHPQAMIGFFLHIAFPSSEVFRCLEKRKQLLQGMLASNVIGFQTVDHCQHFKQTCSRLLYVETTEQGIQGEHSFVNIVALPIGIDPSQLSKDIEILGVSKLADSLCGRYQENGMKVIIGRDKLDHVKGVLHKVRAFGEFLRTNPDQQGRVMLMQFGSCAKQDHILMSEIRDVVSKINSTYSIIAIDYQPILLKPDVSYQEYLALLTMADVFIVSSVREGMNLTCHEYVFCQHQRKNALILSEFVGSAQLFEAGALIVNPFDYKQTAAAIQKALVMSTDEKERRWSLLDKIVHEEDGGHWAETFIAQIQKDFVAQMKKRSVDLPQLNPDSYTEEFIVASQRLIMIDYEGTLLHWEVNVGVIAGTGKIVDLLNELTADRRNIVYITSERTPSELERAFRRVENVGLIAENGGYVRLQHNGIWSNLTSPKILGWKDSVREIVQYYKERTPGTFIEEQNNRIVFHYASAENVETAQRQVSEMHNHIMDSSAAQDIHALPMKNALVLEPSSITKASAAEYVIKDISKLSDIDFVVCFGNDRSDEELFAWVNSFPSKFADAKARLAITINVGIRNTEARMYVKSTFGVHGALSLWLQALRERTVHVV